MREAEASIGSAPKGMWRRPAGVVTWGGGGGSPQVGVSTKWLRTKSPSLILREHRLLAVGEGSSRAGLGFNGTSKPCLNSFQVDSNCVPDPQEHRRVGLAVGGTPQWEARWSPCRQLGLLAQATEMDYNVEQSPGLVMTNFLLSNYKYSL